MSRILITSGPTREYLDPVRYLSNGSSGRMGSALAAAGLAAGHEIIVVSGPVAQPYPDAAQVVPVVSTQEMLDACRAAFATCDGLIAAAAPCDYRPQTLATQKIRKTGQPLELRLVETPDIVAALGSQKRGAQWIVGFALETDDIQRRALAKLRAKNCDLIAANGPRAIDALSTRVRLLAPAGDLVAMLSGSKQRIARQLMAIIDQRFARPGCA